MMKKLITAACLAGGLLAFGATNASAAAININDSKWLGSLKLDKSQLKKIKTAVEKALQAPIDAEQQCGPVRLDCVVRASREWKYEGDTYREIVINIHAVGHASSTVSTNKGKWPKVVAK